MAAGGGVLLPDQTWQQQAAPSARRDGYSSPESTRTLGLCDSKVWPLEASEL